MLNKWIYASFASWYHLDRYYTVVVTNQTIRIKSYSLYYFDWYKNTIKMVSWNKWSINPFIQHFANLFLTITTFTEMFWTWSSWTAIVQDTTCYLGILWRVWLEITLFLGLSLHLYYQTTKYNCICIYWPESKKRQGVGSILSLNIQPFLTLTWPFLYLHLWAKLQWLNCFEFLLCLLFMFVF